MFFPVEQRDKDAASLRRYIAKRIDKKRFHERKNSAPDALTCRLKVLQLIHSAHFSDLFSCDGASGVWPEYSTCKEFER